MREPKKDRVAPYAYIDVFKYFASVSTSNMSVTGDQAAAQADTSSPVGGTLAIGAEYFLGTGFSIEMCIRDRSDRDPGSAALWGRATGTVGNHLSTLDDGGRRAIGQHRFHQRRDDDHFWPGLL